MMEGSGTLEQQLEATRQKAAEVRARRSDLKKIEDLGQILEEHLILDNRYTEHRLVPFIKPKVCCSSYLTLKLD